MRIEKNSDPRIKISPKLVAMLNRLPKGADGVFCGYPISWRSSFLGARKKLALKLQNLRLKQIHFHTLKHWNDYGISQDSEHPSCPANTWTQEHPKHHDLYSPDRLGNR